MSEHPQAPAPQEDDLIPVRYVGAEGLQINGRGVSYGDIVPLPADEVNAWPDPHPYYERADQATGDRQKTTEEGEGVSEAAAAGAAPRTARAAASAASQEQAAVWAQAQAATPQPGQADLA